MQGLNLIMKLIIHTWLKKTTDIHKQNPKFKGYKIISEFEVILGSGYIEYPLGCKNVGCFVDEVIKSENKMAFYFKQTKKDIIMTEEDKLDYRNDKICRFCDKEKLFDKVRDHCH